MTLADRAAHFVGLQVPGRAGDSTLIGDSEQGETSWGTMDEAPFAP